MSNYKNDLQYVGDIFLQYALFFHATFNFYSVAS